MSEHLKADVAARVIDTPLHQLSFSAEIVQRRTAPVQGANGGSSPTSPLMVELISNREADAIVRHLHYLHRARVGQRLSYGIYRGRELEGVIVYARPFTMFVAGRSANSGIEFARLFLLHNYPNDASCAIAITLRRVADDCQRVMGFRPKYVVSWSDNNLHKGTIYAAANFRNAGQTSPRPRGKNRAPRKLDGGFAGPRAMRADHWSVKTMWIYELPTASKGRTRCAGVIGASSRESVGSPSVEKP